jgi:hypothetical protein
MAFKRLVQIAVLWSYGALIQSCGPSLYFGANESHLINRLEKAGDIQLEVNSQVEVAKQHIYQLEAALAVAPFVGVRGSWLTGGDLVWGATKWGKVEARHLGIGSFYNLKAPGYKASSWLGYSQGQSFNEDMRYRYPPDGFSTVKINTFNQYERLFIEQQLRYVTEGIELFGSALFGFSRISDLRYEGILPANSPYAFQYNSQLNRPQALFAVIGVGASGGSPNLRLHLRVDQWFGAGARQIRPLYGTYISTGFNWRIQTKP